MKKFIEAGIKGGLFKDVKGKLLRVMPGYKCLFEHYVDIDENNKDIRITPVYSIYHLLFGTDIVECVVGGKKACVRCGGEEWSSKLMPTVQCENCPSTDFRPLAHYHRSIMANIKDIEKLKEYCRKLIK